MNLNIPVDKQSAAYQQNQLKSARTTLMIAVLFTVLNVVLLLVAATAIFSTVPPFLII